jgi:hypothetical protein
MMKNTGAKGSGLATFKAQHLEGEIKKDYDLKYSWPGFVSQSNPSPSE